MAGKDIIAVLHGSAIVLGVAMKGAAMVFDELRKKKREETTKALESKMNEDLQDLNSKIKALHEDFRKLEESTKNEVQIITAELENQGCREMNVVLLLLSLLDKNLQEFSQKIETMEEDVQEWPETTKRDLQLHRQELESQEREEQNSRAQQCRMEMLLEQLCQRFQSLEQAIEMRQEVPYHDLLLSRRYLENNQGIAMLREEMIHLRVLELARGERINNTWTDSRSAQGALRNRTLCEGQGFFRSVSGEEVEWITPAASDNLHANQDQRTACLDSLLGGIQRSMDIGASRTNDLQVLMLTLGVLISIITLARIFTLPWP